MGGHLFTLKQAREIYRALVAAIEECDREIARMLDEVEPWVVPDEKPRRPGSKKLKTRRAKRTGDFRLDAQRVAYRLFGVDVTQIPGLVGIALGLYSVLGRAMSPWRSADTFSSWLALCTDNDKTGGKVVWRGTRGVKNRAGHLFRMAANALHRSATPSGQFLRRMKAKLGPEAAITATAHQIARIFYTMVKNQVEYDETIWQQQGTQRARRQEARLKRQALKLGYQLVHIQAA